VIINSNLVGPETTVLLLKTTRSHRSNKKQTTRSFGKY